MFAANRDLVLTEIGALKTEPFKQIVEAVMSILCTSNQGNINPDEVEMKGTIRAFHEAMREEIHRRIKQTAACRFRCSLHGSGIQ